MTVPLCTKGSAPTKRMITYATHPSILDRRQQQPQVARTANLALSKSPQEILKPISQFPGWIRQRGLTFIVAAADDGSGKGGRDVQKSVFMFRSRGIPNMYN